MSPLDNSAPSVPNKEPFIRDVIGLARFYVRSVTNFVWPHLGGRRGVIFLTIAVVAAGLAFNWGWLVTIGVAPVFLALAPCALMCALGLCAKGTGKSCSSTEVEAERTPAGATSPRLYKDG